jgi:hydroxymethylpyrimidine/phosphomethylpyrimidine kinase
VPSAPPVVLTIAGFDPSCGAGVTADIKTIAAHRCYGVACITALTVQSTAGVRRVDPVSPQLVFETLEELASDLDIAAVHIGMLACEEIVEAVAGFLAARKLPNIVLDPVIQSSSGTRLLTESGIRSLVAKLLPLAAVVTPNVDEAAILTGLPVGNLEQIREAAARLHGLGSAAVVVTGGHLEQAIDLLSVAGGHRPELLPAEKLQSSSTHGTGCAFATALACNLARRRNLGQAVRLAKDYVTAAISNAYPLGTGIGPVNHLYGMGETGTTMADAGAGNTQGSG